MNHHYAATDIVGAVRDYVTYLQQLGVTGLPLRQTIVPQMSTARKEANLPAAPSPLAQLAASVRDCQKCRLHETRTQVVFGSGSPDADLVFVGEAPGRDEDRLGEAFVGAAGQLLTRIIQAMKLTREQVYILNVVKCRPPNNRNPEPDEVAACRPILEAQLACLKPRVICALGKFAAQTLLQTDESISRLRGHFRNMGDIPVMPTYHPAYLLRNPQGKRAVWEDMQQIQRALDLR
jgi:DNA polymerase